jgi:hypothetical protein
LSSLPNTRVGCPTWRGILAGSDPGHNRARTAADDVQGPREPRIRHRPNDGVERVTCHVLAPRRYPRPVNPITLSGEDWRAVIAVLRAKDLPYMREHADIIERLLERHAADEAMVTRHLTDDVYLRSFNGARLALGIPLPPMER